MAKRVEYRLQNPKTGATVKCVEAGVKPWGKKGYTKELSKETVGTDDKPKKEKADDKKDKKDK